jgi:hypothetical protein
VELRNQPYAPKWERDEEKKFLKAAGTKLSEQQAPSGDIV